MTQFIYKAVPAPRRGEKARGVKTTPDRFALAMTSLMNQMAAEGWDYLRADTLPCDERVGLTGLKTTFQALLIFRRPADALTGADQPAAVAALPFVAIPADTGVAPALGAAVAPIGAAPPVGPAKEKDLAVD